MSPGVAPGGVSVPGAATDRDCCRRPCLGAAGVSQRGKPQDPHRVGDTLVAPPSNGLSDAGSIPATSIVKTEDLMWLVGLLEGEGAFCAGPPSKPYQPLIAVEMTDLDVIQRVAALFSARVCAPKKRQEHWKQSYRTNLKGGRAVDMMNLVRPFMGRRRQGQIDAALACYVPDRRRR